MLIVLLIITLILLIILYYLDKAGLFYFFTFVFVIIFGISTFLTNKIIEAPKALEQIEELRYENQIIENKINRIIYIENSSLTTADKIIYLDRLAEEYETNINEIENLAAEYDSLGKYRWWLYFGK